MVASSIEGAAMGCGSAGRWCTGWWSGAPGWVSHLLEQVLIGQIQSSMMSSGRMSSLTLSMSISFSLEFWNLASQCGLEPVILRPRLGHHSWLHWVQSLDGCRTWLWPSAVLPLGGWQLQCWQQGSTSRPSWSYAEPERMIVN